MYYSSIFTRIEVKRWRRRENCVVQYSNQIKKGINFPYKLSVRPHQLLEYTRGKKLPHPSFSDFVRKKPSCLSRTIPWRHTKTKIMTKTVHLNNTLEILCAKSSYRLNSHPWKVFVDFFTISGWVKRAVPPASSAKVLAFTA